MAGGRGSSGRRGQDALRSAIATRRGFRGWTVDHADWEGVFYSPEHQKFYGKTREEAVAWCLVWLMAPELGIGPYMVYLDPCLPWMPTVSSILAFPPGHARS